jgi:hypothetical protein
MLSNHGWLAFAEIAPNDDRGAEGWQIPATLPQFKGFGRAGAIGHLR